MLGHRDARIHISGNGVYQDLASGAQYARLSVRGGVPMKTHLTDFQRGYAQQRMTFSPDVLSLELTESLRRTSLACAENQKKQAGIVDVICGLYLQDRNEIARHFSGDFAAVVSGNFPVHRFGREGLFPKAMLQGLASESGESSFSFALNYSDDVFRLLWLSQKLANAVGRKPSLSDVIAAVSLGQEWMAELARRGLKPSRALADFDEEVRTVVFHATPHTSEGWRKEMEFEYDGLLQPPFTLEVCTPSGPFQPVQSAKVKLNGRELAHVSWPEKPIVSVGVELRSLNKIEFELDGPAFGSVEVTLRGTPT
jgi:hypothetical protein